MLRAKFHVVSSLLHVIKIAVLMVACQCPMHSIENQLAQTETMVNLKSGSFVIIMHLH